MYQRLELNPVGRRWKFLHHSPRKALHKFIVAVFVDPEFVDWRGIMKYMVSFLRGSLVIYRKLGGIPKQPPFIYITRKGHLCVCCIVLEFAFTLLHLVANGIYIMYTS